MRRLSLEFVLPRGAAAALLVFGAALPLDAQSAGSITVRSRGKDSVIVRIMDPSQRGRMDSLTVLTRRLEDESPLSPRGIELRRDIEAMMTTLRATVQGVGGAGGVTRIMLSGPEGMRQLEAQRLFTGWIGLVTSGSVPHDDAVRNDNYFVRYFAYPSIVSVEPNSPAQRAGIVPGDLLVAYDGNDVVAREINVTQTFVPDRKLSVTVRRDGDNRDYAMTVEKTPQRIFFRRVEPSEMIPFPPGQVFREPLRGRVIGGASAGIVVDGAVGSDVGAARAAAGQTRLSSGGRGRGDYDYVVGGQLVPGRGTFQGPDGVFGASLISLKPELASALKLDMGVLIEQVPEETPAYRSGLRAGDVIVSVAGMSVNTVRDVRLLVFNHAENRSIGVQVVREKKPKLLTVKW